MEDEVKYGAPIEETSKNAEGRPGTRPHNSDFGEAPTRPHLLKLPDPEEDET